jgi:hypothetical protein
MRKVLMSDKTTKVKVIKSTTHIYDDYDNFSALFPVSADWEEVTCEEAERIREAVNYANMNKRNSNGVYVLIEYSEAIKEEVFKLASDFMKAEEKRRLADERRKEEAKRKREEKALERKRKQLEKLKKELEEE